MSTRPWRSTVSVMMLSRSSRFETSHFTNRPSPPTAAISDSAVSPLSGLVPPTTTLAPSRANSSAIPRPMPLVPPAITATLFLSFIFPIRLSRGAQLGHDVFPGREQCRSVLHDYQPLVAFFKTLARFFPGPSDGTQELVRRKYFSFDDSNLFLCFRVRRIAEVSHTAREVHWADEYSVEVFDLQNLVEIPYGLRRLDGD